VQRLNREAITILGQPEIKAKLTDQGVDVYTSTPQEMQKLIAMELDKWGRVVKASGARIN
jgi:tripartite-type tricarboxylate transporter receptor subunit TctC